MSFDRKAYMKRWRQDNPEYGKQWCENNPKYFKTWRDDNVEYFKNWQQENAKHMKQYRKNNAEHIKIYKTRWNTDNAEHIKVYNKQYVKDNAEHIKVYNKQYIKDNSEKCKAYCRKRRALKNNAVGYHTEQDLEYIYEQQNGKCISCGNKFSYEKMTLDHIKPLSKGGSDLPVNIQLLCGSCNCSKGNYHATDYREFGVDLLRNKSTIRMMFD